MMLKQVFDDVVGMAEAAAPKDDDTYEKDGLIYCAKCNTPRQTRKVVFGKERVLPILCECLYAEYEQKKEAERREKQLQAIMKNRQDGFHDQEMQNSTFSVDDGKRPELTNAMRAYVENFQDLRRDGKGLLLYGPVGTGKTFHAACVVNALIDRGHPCMMTDLTRLVNIISEMHEGRQGYIDRLARYDLVVLDDLGVERNTEYMNEQVSAIINSLYRANVPMIVTTNHAPKQMAGENEIRKVRIYDRLLERCHPIKVDGASRRREKGRDDFKEVNRILGIQKQGSV